MLLFRSAGDLTSLDLSPDVAVPLQVRAECPDLFEDASNRLCREAVEGYATN